MRTMNLINTALLVVILALSIASYKRDNAKTFQKTPVPVSYFLQGDTLEPDYCCPDTCIVTDAKGLNEAYAYYEQGFNDWADSQIDSVFHQHTRVIIKGSFDRK